MDVPRPRRGASASGRVRARPTEGPWSWGSAGLGALVGALVWLAWLGWDRSPSYDVVTASVQAPYVTLQVVGCALTLAVLTAVLAARGRPVAAGVGVGVGFWLVWTTDASSQDDSGLFVIGALLLGSGLAVGMTVAAALGWGAARALAARGRRRAASSGTTDGGTTA